MELSSTSNYLVNCYKNLFVTSAKNKKILLQKEDNKKFLFIWDRKTYEMTKKKVRNLSHPDNFNGKSNFT